MAIHEGVIQLRGKIGNQVHSLRNGKHVVKSTSDKKPKQSKATRKSGSDFGRASTATALIRRGFKPLFDQLSDNGFDGRLKRVLINIVNTGPKALQGSRQVTDGDVALLKKLAFNRYTPVQKLTTLIPSIEIDPCNNMTISLPRMQVKDMFYPPPKATQAVLQFCCCLFYFDLKNGRYKMPEDLHISLEQTNFPGGKFSLPLADAGDCVLAAAWGIHFISEDDSRPIGNRKYYAGNFIEAVNIVDGKIVTFQYPGKVIATPPPSTENRIAWEMNEE